MTCQMCNQKIVVGQWTVRHKGTAVHTDCWVEWQKAQKAAKATA